MDIKHYLKHRRTLRNIKRFNMETVFHPQNLADHGFNVANLYFLICQMMCKPVSGMDLHMVMNHDFAECFTGDLNLAVKNHIPEEWDKIESKMVPKEIERFTDKGIKKHFTDGGHDFPENYDLFLFADAFEAYLYCEDEVKMGNKLLEPALKRYQNKLTNMNPELLFTLIQIKKELEEQ